MSSVDRGIKLRTFVQRFVEQKSKQTFPHLYIVDKETGPYKKIQDAIDAAEPGSLIKISEGFYEQNIIVTKSLRFEPKELSESSQKIGVVLLASSGFAVHIKMQEYEQKCEITGIKFSHSGNSETNLKKQLMQHQHLLNIFQGHDSLQQLQNEYINRTTFRKVQNMILLIERGKLTMTNCILSLNYLVKSCSCVIPAVWVDKEASLSMDNCDLKGHESKQTIGIVCKLGFLMLENSSISNHSEGGVLIWGLGDNTSKISKNSIENNSVGIYTVGEEFRLKIDHNNISNNHIGVKVGLACESVISHNQISCNRTGIEINSAFPSISFNKVEKNHSNGIHSRSHKKYLCKAQIYKNISIVGNKTNGILIEGQNNTTTVSHNYLIGFNCQAGIRIAGQAFPTLSRNLIHKNYKEGVICVQRTSCIALHNTITHNVEANVSLGGEHSHHSLICENVIADSYGTGVILIEAGKCLLSRNDIVRNHDGVFMSKSEPQLRRNYIAENGNNGVLCQGRSNPLIIENFITRNSSAGLFLRDQSGLQEHSPIHSNILVSNEIDLAFEEYNEQLIKKLKKCNTVEGEIYYPEPLQCNVI